MRFKNIERKIFSNRTKEKQLLLLQIRMSNKILTSDQFLPHLGVGYCASCESNYSDQR